MTTRHPSEIGPPMHASILWWLTTMALWVFLSMLPAAQAAESGTNAPSPQDYSFYRLIAERNIFNTNRFPRTSRTNRPVEKPKKVESFSLVGIMSYEKGSFAFFDGTSSDYKKACPLQGQLAGYTIQEIKPERVKLTDSTNQFDLAVGMQMRREDEAPWRLIASSDTLSAPRTEETGSSSSNASDGPVSDILKRLREKREKELN